MSRGMDEFPVSIISRTCHGLLVFMIQINP